MTVKWDGAPAIFAGINPENNQFFVGTKGAFNKNAKINYSHDDIDRNHTNSGLNQKLKVAFSEHHVTLYDFLYAQFRQFSERNL